MTSILGNGSVLRPQHAAYSEFMARRVINATRLMLFRALSNEYEAAGLKVYITGDGSDVYEDSFLKVAKSSEGTFRPTLVLVGIRLGIDRVTPVYWEALKATLQLPQSIGIAGSVASFRKTSGMLSAR